MIWKALHVCSELGDDHLGGALGDAGDRREQLELMLERAQALLDLGRERIDRLVQVVDVGEQLRDQQRVVGGEAARECPAKLRQLSPQLAARKLRQRLGIVSALTELGE